MIILSQSTDSLKVVLNAAKTSADMQAVCSWRDTLADASQPGRTCSTTNGTTDAVLAAATASAIRLIDYFSVYNSDTAQKTLTVKYAANATQYILWSGPLNVGEKLEYTDGIGFQVFDANGLCKIGTTATNTFSGTAPTTATTGTMSVSMTTPQITITPTGACTFNATGGQMNQLCSFVVTTSGATSFVLTFGTNFLAQGTLATGTTTAKKFTLLFQNMNGTIWQEVSRTIAM